MKLSKLKMLLNGYIIEDGFYYINCDKHGEKSKAYLHGYYDTLTCLKCMEEQKTGYLEIYQ